MRGDTCLEREARTWRKRGSAHMARKRLSRWRATRSLRHPMRAWSARASTPVVDGVECSWLWSCQYDLCRSRPMDLSPPIQTYIYLYKDVQECGPGMRRTSRCVRLPTPPAPPLAVTAVYVHIYMCVCH